MTSSQRRETPREYHDGKEAPNRVFRVARVENQRRLNELLKDTQPRRAPVYAYHNSRSYSADGYHGGL